MGGREKEGNISGWLKRVIQFINVPVAHFNQLILSLLGSSQLLFHPTALRVVATGRTPTQASLGG